MAVGCCVERSTMKQQNFWDVDLVELFAEGAVQIWVVMAMDVRPDRGVAVEVTLPFPIDQPAPFAAATGTEHSRDILGLGGFFTEAQLHAQPIRYTIECETIHKFKFLKIFFFLGKNF